jgi:hypothetical protein
MWLRSITCEGVQSHVVKRAQLGSARVAGTIFVHDSSLKTSFFSGNFISNDYDK